MEWLQSPDTGFEPTYEGLKLGRLRYHPLSARSFEPTYEGLKLGRLRYHPLSARSFEPTYEGLKLQKVRDQTAQLFTVLSLPTRD